MTTLGRPKNGEKVDTPGARYQRERREKDPEGTRELNRIAQRKWIAENPERHKANRDAWNEANKEKIREQKAAYYQTNKDRINALRRARYQSRKGVKND